MTKTETPTAADCTESTPPYHILMLSPEYPPERIVGGLTTHLFELASGLGRRGCQVTVLSLTSNEATVQQQGNVTAHWLPIDQLPLDAPTNSTDHILSTASHAFAAAAVPYARPLIEQAARRPDLIHTHDWFTFPAARALGTLYNIPVVCSLHGLLETSRWWGENPHPALIAHEYEACQQATAVITVSHALRAVVQAVCGVPDERMFVVHNGMDMQPFVAAARQTQAITTLRRTLGHPEDQIILFVGRLVPQKGIESLLESAPRVIAQYPGTRYLIAGGGDVWGTNLTTEHRSLVAPSIRDRVTFLGKVPRAQLGLLYQVADLVVLPSIYEPFGYTAVEAMAAGTALIATDVGGFSEIIEHEQHGLLVPVDTAAGLPHAVDVEQLTAAQLRLLKDAALRQQFGEAARNHVVGRFTREAMVAAMLNVYQQVLASQRAVT